VQYKKATFIILLTFFIILTGSTKGLIGLILIYMIYILNNYNFKKALIIIPIVTVLFSAGLLINGKAIDRANDKLNDFAGVSSGEYRADNIGHDSGKIRIFLALQAISVYMENKLTGVGVNNGQYYLELPDAFKSEMESINSQNNYTEMLLNVGILGFAMYYFPILYLLIRTMQSKGCHRHIRTLIISIIFLKIFMDVGMKSYNDAGHVFIVILAWYLYLTLLNTNKIIDR
jgi:O-antigen ligase